MQMTAVTGGGGEGGRGGGRKGIAQQEAVEEPPQQNGVGGRRFSALAGLNPEALRKSVAVLPGAARRRLSAMGGPAENGEGDDGSEEDS